MAINSCSDLLRAAWVLLHSLVFAVRGRESFGKSQYYVCTNRQSKRDSSPPGERTDLAAGSGVYEALSECLQVTANWYIATGTFVCSALVISTFNKRNP